MDHGGGGEISALAALVASPRAKLKLEGGRSTASAEGPISFRCRCPFAVASATLGSFHCSGSRGVDV